MRQSPFRLRWRRFKRRIVVALRKHFYLDEDMVRDQVLDGMRRDVDQMSRVLQTTVNTLNRTNDQLRYYESEIPALGKARKVYDKKLKRAQREAEAKRAKSLEVVKATLNQGQPAPGEPNTT